MKKALYPKPVDYSKSQINAFGDVLRYDGVLSSEEQYEAALAGVNSWRASHLYPLNTFRSTLSRKVHGIGGLNGAIVAQRLKRMPTIIAKLKRNPKMELSRMQDVGGLRAIVKNLHDVYGLEKYYREINFSHKLVNEKDYIKTPKSDGYRGIHMVFKYHGTNDVARSYDGLLVELQIRTKLQHTWATAVEVAGMLRNEKLKNDDGNAQWLDFFKEVSLAFEMLEFLDGGKKYITLSEGLDAKSLYEKIKKIDEKQHILEKLEAFSGAVNFLDVPGAGKNKKFFLITLDPTKKQVRIVGFNEEQYEDAITEYQKLEQENAGTSIDQVLVSAGNLKQLRTAYPNYFADIDEFASKVRSIESMV